MFSDPNKMQHMLGHMRKVISLGVIAAPCSDMDGSALPLLLSTIDLEMSLGEAQTLVEASASSSLPNGTPPRRFLLDFSERFGGLLLLISSLMVASAARSDLGANSQEGGASVLP